MNYIKQHLPTTYAELKTRFYVHLNVMIKLSAFDVSFSPILKELLVLDYVSSFFTHFFYTFIFRLINEERLSLRILQVDQLFLTK